MTYKRDHKTFKAKLSAQKTLNDIRAAVREAMDDWSTEFPTRGPCWPVARVLANAGLGRVEYCQVYCKTEKQWYGHFLVRTPEGKIIDCSGEYICQDCAPRRAAYKTFSVYDNQTHPAYSDKTVAWWHRRLRRFLGGS